MEELGGVGALTAKDAAAVPYARDGARHAVLSVRGHCGFGDFEGLWSAGLVLGVFDGEMACDTRRGGH